VDVTMVSDEICIPENIKSENDLFINFELVEPGGKCE
jgi:hypothetical protein